MLSLSLLGLSLIPMALGHVARAPVATAEPIITLDTKASTDTRSCNWIASTTVVTWIPAARASTSTVTAATMVYYWNSTTNSTQTSLKKDSSFSIPSGHVQLQYNAQGTQVTTAVIGDVTTVVAYPTEYAQMGKQYAVGSSFFDWSSSDFPSSVKYPAATGGMTQDPKGTGYQPRITTMKDTNSAFYTSAFPSIKAFSTCAPDELGLDISIKPEVDVAADPVVVVVTAEQVVWVGKRTNSGPRRSAAPKPLAAPEPVPASQTQAQTMLSKVVNLGSTTVTVTGGGTTIGTGTDAVTIALTSAASAVASTVTAPLSAVTTAPVMSPSPVVSGNGTGNGTTRHLTPVLVTYLSSMTLSGGGNASATLTSMSGSAAPSATAATTSKTGAATQLWAGSCALSATFVVGVLALVHAL